MTRELSVHSARLDEFAQVLLSRLMHDVDAKGFIKLFRRANAAKAVYILLGVVPFRLRNFWVHMDNAEETLHCLLASPGIFIRMLPESLDLSSLGLVFTMGVVVEANASFRRIEIISNRKTPDANGHFLPYELLRETRWKRYYSCGET